MGRRVNSLVDVVRERLLLHPGDLNTLRRVICLTSNRPEFDTGKETLSKCVNIDKRYNCSIPASAMTSATQSATLSMRPRVLEYESK